MMDAHGDVASIDELGFIDIRDRIKDVIKTAASGSLRVNWRSGISKCAALKDSRLVVRWPDPQWEA